MFQSRRTWILLAVALAAGTPAGSCAGQEYRKGDEVIALRDLALKLDSRIVGTVSSGERLTVEDVQGDWLWVRSGETRGWVERWVSNVFRHLAKKGILVFGVTVNARGVLEVQSLSDQTGQLRRQQILAARQSLSRDVLAPSHFRKVSLTRLERAIRDKNGVVTEEMKYLAGLLRVKYVFSCPESKDIVIAGPAEGWRTDAAGRVVGITSDQPVIQLQDLATVLRAFPPGEKPTPEIGCSIDPTAEGLAAMQQFMKVSVPQQAPVLRQMFNSGRQQAVAAWLTAGLRKSLGLQEISINGVPGATHFAQVMVEADYRMKLIGAGLEEPPVKIVGFVQQPTVWEVNPLHLIRWYLSPEYQCVRVAKDRLAMELVGDGVRLIAEEWDSERGVALTTLSRANEAFTTSFTKNYAQLAQHSPVYAELRNIIHLAVAGAFIQEQDYYGKADWNADFLRDEKSFPVQTYSPPQQVASAVAAIVKGQRIMTPIGGAVRIEPAKALSPENLLRDEHAEVANMRANIELPKAKWWWD